ncbi:MAG: ankyrin repeat domain-containing protein [Blastocatellia bacterium]|nr:ankyrin repeat domain-containing protein [Blastocatellia bacterium]
MNFRLFYRIVFLGMFLFLTGCTTHPPGPEERSYNQLRFAISMGNVAEVKKLVEANPNLVTLKDKEFSATALHEAAFYGNREIAEVLLAKGADVNAKAMTKEVQGQPGNPSVAGHTPMHLAAMRGHRDLAELLLAKGADLNARDRYGETPLDYARKNNQTEMTAWLMAKGGQSFQGQK